MIKTPEWMKPKRKYQFMVYETSKVKWKDEVSKMSKSNQRTFAPSRIYRLWNYSDEAVSEFAVGPYKRGWVAGKGGTNAWPEGRTKVS